MRVATPCHVGWDSMDGDDRTRFCGSCERNVYNIIGLSRGEIQSLVQTTEGRLCVRMYQRADETVLTQDCPVGLRAVRKRVAALAGAALSALLGLVSVGFGQKPEDRSETTIKVERVKIDSKKGQISGSIFDMHGAVVPGIEIKLQLEKRSLAKVTSDNEGNFTIHDVNPAANYTLRLNGEKGGWKKHIIKGITVNSGEKLSYNLFLEPKNAYVVVGLYGQSTEVSPNGILVTDATFIPRQTQPVPITLTQISKPKPTPQ